MTVTRMPGNGGRDDEANKQQHSSDWFRDRHAHPQPHLHYALHALYDDRPKTVEGRRLNEMQHATI
ncbi:unnamed protein product [Toxocara canis]|nr:unnamed protein product [Toxocara canis]